MDAFHADAIMYPDSGWDQPCQQSVNGDEASYPKPLLYLEDELGDVFHMRPGLGPQKMTNTQIKYDTLTTKLMDRVLQGCGDTSK